ncbi:hypothetical protein [Mycobacterium sp.]|uniref:hypothetical protein n=1 Tax=Mycobacterium sp. TaxID=1785 RepID=UPI0031DF639A
MWCPSATLSVWANAWLAGRAAPDDVLDALSCWAPRQSVMADDSVAAGRAGLAWPDIDKSGAASLLGTLRSAAGRAPASGPSVGVVLPVPGDVRGLPAGTQFESDALAAGEAVILASLANRDVAVGLVPEFAYDESGDDAGVAEVCEVTWTVYSLPGPLVLEQHELGAAEHALRSAVRSATETLAAAGLGSTIADVADPRRCVEQLVESARQHRIPDHAPARAVRVLENASHIDAIMTVSAALTPIAAQSLSEAQIAGNALRALAPVVRSARMAALSVILHSAWYS